MNLGEFRRLTKDLPDDADILGNPGGGEISEIHTDVTQVLPPVLEHPYAVILNLGQQVWIELDLDARRDAQWVSKKTAEGE